MLADPEEPVELEDDGHHQTVVLAQVNQLVPHIVFDLAVAAARLVFLLVILVGSLLL